MLSNPKLEGNLHDRFDALLFAGLDLHCAVRGETPDFGSRNARVKAGAWGGLRAGVCHQIEGHRLKMKEAKAVIITSPLRLTAPLGPAHILRRRQRTAPNMRPPMRLRLLPLGPITMRAGSIKATRAR